MDGDEPTGPGAPLARIRRFGWELARGQASEVVEVGWGFAVRHDRFPVSQQHNRLVVTDLVDAGTVLAAADAVFGPAGLDYRRVDVEAGADGALATALAAATGGALATELALARTALAAPADGGRRHPEPGAPVPPDGPEPGAGPAGVARRTVEHIRVQRPPFAATRDLIDRSWRADLPDLDAEGRRQLVERVPEAARVRELTQHAVSAGGEVVALCHLLRSEDTAEIEGVYTLPEARGRGYARAVVLDAVDLAASSGCDLVFLYAAEDDWPQHLYRRLGFVDVGRTSTVLWRA